MEDDKSTAVEADIAVDEPADDPILAVLSDTEDSDDTAVVEVETQTEPEPSEAEAEPEAETPPEETEDLQPPVDPKEEARKRYEERQRINAERRQSIESTVTEQAEQYVKQGEDEYDQRLRQAEARDALRDAQQYVNNIEHNEQTIVNDFERVKSNPDLQIFNPESPDFNQSLYNKELRSYMAEKLEHDQSGNIIGVKGSLFEHLTETAELFKGAVRTGAVQQVRAANQMRNNADIKPAATPKDAPKDAILDILKSDD